MSGKFGHILSPIERIKHFTRAKLPRGQYRYNYDNWFFDLDARTGLDTYTNLARISSWRDTIAGINFSQATAANQPQYQASDANFNNLPSVDFDTAARVLSASYNGQNIGIPSSITIAFVAKVNTIHTVNTLFGPFGANTQWIGLSGTTAGVTGIGVYEGAASAKMVTTVEDTNSHIVVITSTEIVVDGVQQVTGSWPPLASFDTLGYDTTTTSRNFRGRLSRLMMRAGTLTSAECIDLYNKMNNEY